MRKKVNGVRRLNRDDLVMLAGFIGGVFLLIHIVTALAVMLSGEGTSLMVSSILLPIAAGVGMLILGAGHVLLTFVQAVQFGQTRRTALALTAAQLLTETAFAGGLAWGLSALEQKLAPGFWLWLTGAEYITYGIDGRRIPEGAAYVWPGDELLIETFVLDWWWILLIVLGCAGLGFVGGAVVQRFGKRGGWTLWGIFMVVCLGLPRLPWARYTIVDWLFPLLGVLAAASLVWSIWSLLRAVIR